MFLLLLEALEAQVAEAHRMGLEEQAIHQIHLHLKVVMVALALLAGLLAAVVEVQVQQVVLVLATMVVMVVMELRLLLQEPLLHTPVVAAEQGTLLELMVQVAQVVVVLVNTPQVVLQQEQQIQAVAVAVVVRDWLVLLVGQG
jgi:hypothetical protein